MTDQKHSQRPDALPKARVEKAAQRYWIWIVPALAAAFVAWLVYRTVAEAGPAITILFKSGKGIEVGKTAIKYRGVTIGTVHSLKLSPDRQYVMVEAVLGKSAAGIASEGSEFWIVEPEVSLEAIRGLRTIVSGDYIQVKPGNGKPATKFIGIEE